MDYLIFPDFDYFDLEEIPEDSVLEFEPEYDEKDIPAEEWGVL